MTDTPSRPRAGSSGGHDPFAPRVRAVLGPTNTGKTHLAMERLLGHGSGIIGFPLRLLARENYDRMVAQKGAAQVGLITGEEKIVPPGARWFSCTVEAMPLDPINYLGNRASRDLGPGRGDDEMPRPEFVAVDEIQLCADPDRGHVFTDRLLHARGLVETMFLGAETIRPLLQRLVPGVEIETRPRLSQLLHVGGVKLTKLPPRSAVVAFSAAEVYAIAELIRRRRGGCAVVMGRLSPRTRNAQVALYQDKEVDYLVATDAIGMGLNMDVNHVGFAGLSKFDGARPRRLTAAEVAQIGGRAGRGMRDGTFGTTGTCAPMPDEIVEAVEAHRFDPLEQLFWRNSALDLSGPDALVGSLLEMPGIRGLVSGNEASDLQTLQALVGDPEVRRLAVGRSATRLLWDACQIPDFRKLGDDSHARLCARVFHEVMQAGRISESWLEQLLATLNRGDGDIDTLMQRLTGVRVCAYIAARRDWLPDAAAWQARAREIEDLLSDALHERLTARFVDRRAALLIRSLDEAERGGGAELLSAVTPQGEVVVEGHSVGHVSGFALIPDPQAVGPEKRLVLRAARRALREEIPRRVLVLAAAADGAFGLSADGRLVCWEQAPVGRLRPGPALLRPMVEVLDSEFLDGSQRERVRARLQAFLEAMVAHGLAPLFAAERGAAEDPELRGLLHGLVEHAGLAPGAPRAPIPPPVRARLKALGVRAGRYALFMPALLKPRPARLRAVLLALRAGIPLPALPPEGRISLPRPDPAPSTRTAAAVPAGTAASVSSGTAANVLAGTAAKAPARPSANGDAMPPNPPPATEPPIGDAPPAFLVRLGWVACGPVMLRLDIAERVAGELGWLARRRPTAMPPDLPSRLSIRAELLPHVLPALDVRMLAPSDLADGMFGPPGPVMLAARTVRPRAQPRAPRQAETAPDETVPRPPETARDPGRQARRRPRRPIAAEARPLAVAEPAPVVPPAPPPPRTRPPPPPRPVRVVNPDSPFAVLAGLRFGR